MSQELREAIERGIERLQELNHATREVCPSYGELGEIFRSMLPESKAECKHEEVCVKSELTCACSKCNPAPSPKVCEQEIDCERCSPSRACGFAQCTRCGKRFNITTALFDKVSISRAVAINWLSEHEQADVGQSYYSDMINELRRALKEQGA